MDWYPRYPAHYDRGTLHLTLAEHGAYCRLIDYYMQSEEPLPENDRALAAVLRCSLDDWMAVAETVRAFFQEVDGKLIHKRCDRELKTQRKNLSRKAQTSRENGKKGGRPKGSKNKAKKPTGFSEKTEAEPNHNPEKPTDRYTDIQTEDIQSSVSNTESNYSDSKPSGERGAQDAQDDNLDLPDFLDKRNTNGKGGEYAFVGRVIRLDQDQIDRWSEAYPNIPDLNAELTKADDHYAENPPADGKWFFKVSRWLEKAHDDHAPKKPDPRTDPAYWDDKADKA